MKTRCLIPLMVVAAFMLMPQAALADDLADLKAAVKMSEKAFSTGDVETGIGYFHEGAVRIAPRSGFPLVMNLARIKPRWIKFFETHIWRIRWYKVEYRVIGNTGLVWGVRENTTINKKSGSVARQFLKGSATWVKSDGKWKIVLLHGTPIPSTQTLN